MRLRLKFTLKGNEIPRDYRPFILSLLKYSISRYDQTLYKDLYENGAVPKRYTFSVWLDAPEFQQESILLHTNRLDIQFTTYDTILGIHLYNSFIKMKNKEFSIPLRNALLLTEIQLVPEKIIIDRKIQVKFISPMVIRSHTKNDDYYYSIAHPKFHDELLKTLRYQLEQFNDLPLSLLNSFSMTPINPQKTVVQFYGQQIEATLGTFELKGDPVLLDYFYKQGIGSRRSSGFGMFVI